MVKHKWTVKKIRKAKNTVKIILVKQKTLLKINLVKRKKQEKARKNKLCNDKQGSQYCFENFFSLFFHQGRV